MSVQSNHAQLNDHNKTLLDEMKFYLLSSHVSESKARTVLAELEDHLLLAQQDGKSFENVFGQDPKSYCDELIKEIPKPTWWERAKLLLLIPFLLLLYKLAEGIDGNLHLSVLDEGMYLAISFIFLGAIFYFLRRTSFKPYKTAYWMILSLALFIMLIFIGLEFAEKKFWPEGPSFELNGGPAYAIGAGSILLIIASLFWTTFAKKQKV